MKSIMKLIYTLTLICAVCSALLAFVHLITCEQIKSITEKNTKAAVARVLPAGVTIEDHEGVYTGIDADGQPIAFATLGRSKNGYGGEIVLMVGITTTGKLTSYEKIIANETPGLGSKLNDPTFKNQFAEKSLAIPLRVRKDGGVIDAITSATITSRAVCEAIADAHKTITAFRATTSTH